MSAWTLPGRENDPVMRYKAILETSFAFSRTFNPRNMEFHWYSLWAQTLSDLVADIPNLIVAPQFPVWFVPEHDEHEDEDDGDDPEIIAQLGPEGQEGPRGQAEGNGDDEGGDGVGDTSMAPTVPEENTESVVVDFVILHLRAVAQPQTKWRIRYGGWRITTANIGLLVEVKRFPSRSLKGRPQEDEIRSRIVEAKIDLLKQAAHLFIENPNRDSVLAIAAAGPHWCSTTIFRTNVKRRMYVLSERDPSYQDPDEQVPDPDLKWNAILRVNLAQSRNRLRRIHGILEAMGVLEIPADV